MFREFLFSRTKLASCVFFTRKSVIATETLIEFDTALAIATSVWRTAQLLREREAGLPKPTIWQDAGKMQNNKNRVHLMLYGSDPGARHMLCAGSISNF